MRSKKDAQARFDFQPSNLKLTNDYSARYEAISKILDQTPKLLDRVHRDLRKALARENRPRRRKSFFSYTSEMVFRLALCQRIEGLSLRETIVRVDDSHFLRRFARINDGPMMNYTTLCRLKNAIRPGTWKELNRLLAQSAVERGQITGRELRLDTTAVETNIHWPTDSSLLWDGYRTLGRLLGQVREMDPESVGNRRIHLDRAKKLALRITRKAHAKNRKASDLKPLYKRLIRQVGGLCDWAEEIVPRLEKGLESNRYGVLESARVAGLLEELPHFVELCRHVMRQAAERVIHENPVPNEKKLFSLFEPHTELLKRGKSGKPIEFGHMIQIQQVEGKFITDYEVFERRPHEPTLIEPALRSHEKLFGDFPESFSADKGYWSQEEVEELREQIPVFSIPKKGRRSRWETEREHDPLFRMAQRFRAGIEGSISFLKRVLSMLRCLNKGWESYVSTVGATIFAHNLLVLARE